MNELSSCFVKVLFCKMVKRLYALVALLLICLVSFSQEMSDSVFHLDEFVVTGTRTPKLLKDAPVQTRLITADDIKRTDATNIQDLLQQELPGVEFSYAMNQQINMNFSGFAGQSVLILIDGERLAGETMDNVDYTRLNMSNIARIEIIKGAASALYGSNAAGGVINIITKDADKPWNLNINARLAAHNEQRYGGSVGMKQGMVNNTLDVQHTTIDTYSVCDTPTDACQYRSVFGFNTWNFKDRITFHPLTNLKFTGRLGYFFKERLYNVDMPDRYRDFTGGVRGEWAISERDKIELSYNYDQYDKSDYQRIRKLDIRDYSNVQHTTRALYSHQLREKDILTVGGDVLRDYLNSYQFANGAKHQYTSDVFAQYDWNIDDKWEVIGAGRWDYFSDGNHSQATGKLGFRYDVGKIVVRGGYAGGFRAPSLKEKYMKYDMQGIFWIVGNKDLVAEKSHNFNASAELTHGCYNFTIAANYNVISDKLTNTPPLVSTEDPTYNYVQYINVDNMKVFGLEATAQAKWTNGLIASLSYNYTHEDVSGSGVLQYCPSRPHSMNAKISWNKLWCTWYSSDISLTGRFLSSVTYNTVEMTPPFKEYPIHNPAYSLWKMQLTNHFPKGITVNLAIENLFNYKPIMHYYNTPTTTGMNFIAGVSWEL